MQLILNSTWPHVITYTNKQTEKKENSMRDTNVTNNKQAEKKENSARDTKVTNKQKRKKTMREILT